MIFCICIEVLCSMKCCDIVYECSVVLLVE